MLPSCRSRAVGRPQTLQDLLTVGTARAQTGQHHRAIFCRLVTYHQVQTALRHAEQRRLEADLYKDPGALLVQRSYAIGETHRGTHMAYPVVRVRYLLGRKPAGHVRDQEKLG